MRTTRLWHSVCAPFKAPPPEHVYRPVGCLECRNTGYLGRVGIYEIMRDHARDQAADPGRIPTS